MRRVLGSGGREPHSALHICQRRAPCVMKAYIEVRTQCEEMIGQSGLNATILRPWYVLGPGHYWPYLLKPGYWLGRQIPSWRESATRLGLVTLTQMVAALVRSVEDPAKGIRVVEVPEITKAAS